MGKYVCTIRSNKEFKQLAKELELDEDEALKFVEKLDNEAAAAGVTLSDAERLAKIKKTLKYNTVSVYDDEKDYKIALNEWHKADDGHVVIDAEATVIDPFGEGSPERIADISFQRYKSIFGEENVVRYTNSDGDIVIRISKPVLQSSSSLEEAVAGEDSLITAETNRSNEPIEINTLEQAETIVNILKAFSDKHIKFDKEEHGYHVDGKKVNTSVTQFIYGKKDLGAWGTPSTAIGNTADAIVRDFFKGELKESYPNMSKKGLEILVDNLKAFQKMLDKKFGGKEHYRVVTDEFYISAKYTVKQKNGKNITKRMAGSMDMLIYDDKGNFYIYDMKAKRSGLSDVDKENYSKQLSLYKAILEANFPELKGKIKELKIIPLRTSYEIPVGVDGGMVKYTVDEDGNLFANGKPILDNPDAKYSQPNLILSELDDLVSLESQEFDEEFEALDAFDKDLLMEEIGSKSTKEEYEESELDREKNTLYNNPLLTAEERAFLAKSLMQTTSWKITHLQKYKGTLREMVDNLIDTGLDSAMSVAQVLEQYVDVDFTSMSRNEIIRVLGLNNIFNWVKEIYFNPDNASDLELDALDKLDLVYNNWEALKQEGYAELIMLEDITVIQADQVIKDGVDNMLQEAMEADVEHHEREYWQIHFRQISAMAGLSTRIRREIERLQLIDLDNDGAPVLDETFGLPMYVDSGVAVSSILEWVKDCNTVSEMEEVLGGLVDDFPWLAAIVGYHKDGLNIEGLMEEEPFRSQFFSNFRKDFTEYSTVLVEVDENGRRKYTPHIINTKGATRFLLDEVVNSFQEGAMPEIVVPIPGDIEGRGRVNMKTVNVINEEWAEVKETLDSLSGKKRKFKSYIQKEVPRITSWLNTLGIMVSPQNIEALFTHDYDLGTYSGSNIAKIMEKVKHITNTLKEHSKDNDYNPMIKNKRGNLYGDYKDIIQMVSKFVQDGIEASTYENGKMYYSFQTPSHMGKLISNLKDALKDPNRFSKFIEENYRKYRWFYTNSEGGLLSDGEWLNSWIGDLVASSEFREALDHKVQLNFDGTEYRDLSELGYTLSLMSEFFYDSNKRWAWYRMPILSNKPSSEFIKFRRYSRNFEEEILSGLTKVVTQEVLRIRTVLDTAGENLADNFSLNSKVLKSNPSLIEKRDARRKLKEDLDSGKISKKAYDRKVKSTYYTFDDLVKNKELITSKSGASFKFLEALNNEIINKTALGQMLLDKINDVEYSVEENSRYIKALKDTLKADMDLIVSREVEQWQKIGLFETEDQSIEIKEGKGKNEKTIRFTLPKYKYLQSFIPSPQSIYNSLAKERKHADRFNSKGELKQEFIEAYNQAMTNEAMRALKEYVWNDLFATINIIELTATDLAYFKNVEDFQKRYAAVHSPGLRPNVEATFIDEKGNEVRYSDGKCRVMHIADIFESSELKENVRKVFEDRIARERDPRKKAELRKMADLILSQYDSFNITDGQGYSSPTSYRKKMGMMGRWTEAEERAYQNIRNGNFTVEDLGIVWQPLKPFIYTQLDRTTGSDVMSEIKVPMQVKDSEYMLLLADALIRGGKRQNKLTALFDFMEDSAYDGRISSEGKVINPGTYNGKGIDTIAFVSTSKFGAAKVVDISDRAVEEYRENNPEAEGMSDYAVMKTILNNAAYYNEDHTEVAENDFSRYDDSYVHEFDYEDYAIQQEVPSHLMDHEQAMGSQIRILSISDINPTDRFSVGDSIMNGEELVSEYQDLIARNIRDSFNAIIKEFHLDSASKVDRNKALEKLLRETILKDQRYGTDLLRACTLNDQGEFTIPLADPVQSTRIQQLLNSIIKSRINKQRVKGGPVVQTSVFGFSDELHIRFKNKNGGLLMTLSEYMEANNFSSEEIAVAKYKEYIQENQGELAYWEIYISVPSEAMETALIEMGKKNGKDYFNNIDEAIKDGIINEEMLKAIGYRIPTEDKYSMAPMRIKGFMPRAAGEAIVMPKEITLLTGSDFDIDKMYIMFKEFNEKKFTWNSLALSKADKTRIVNEISRMHPELVKKVPPMIEHTFSQPQLNEIFKKIYTDNPKLYTSLKILRNISGEFHHESHMKNGKEVTVTVYDHPLNYYFDAYPNSLAGKWIANRAKELGFNSIKEYKQSLVYEAATALDYSPEVVEIRKEGYLAMDDDSIAEAGLSKYQVFKEAADNLNITINEKAFNPTFTLIDNLEERAGRNNRIFDLQWASLTSESSLNKMFNPGSFDVQKKTARIVTILKDPSNKYSYNELAKMTLEELSEKAEAATGKNICLSTTQVYFHKQNMTAGKLIGIFANNNTSHAFISMQNVHLNLDDKTSFVFDGSDPVTSDRLDNILARDGITLISKNIAGFLAASVDAVKDPVLNFLNLNTLTTGPAMVLTRLGFDVDSVGLFLTQPIIEKTVSEYFKRNNEGYVSPDEIINEMKKFLEDKYKKKSEVVENNLTSNKFTKDDMGYNLKVDLDKMSSLEADFQLESLVLLQKLLRISNQMNTMTFLTKFNSVTNAPGPTIADTIVMRERYNKFKELYTNKRNLLSEGALNVINNSPILKAFYDTTISDESVSRKIFEPFFPHYSISFTNALSSLTSFMKTAPDAKLINSLVNDYILYKLTAGDNPVIDMSYKKRQEYIHIFPKAFNIEASKALDNALLKIIQTKARNRRCPVTTLETKTGSFNATQQEAVRNAWSVLIQNSDTRDFGISLFYYNIMRSGFAFSPKTFLHLASVDVKLAIDGYVEALRDPRFNDEEIDDNMESFLYQFLRNHADNGKIVPKIREDEKLKGMHNKKDGTITFLFNKKDIRPNFLADVDNIQVEDFAPVIWYKGKLYMQPDDLSEAGDMVKITYTQTTTLGNTNNFLEYSANPDEGGAHMESAIEQVPEREKPHKERTVTKEDDDNGDNGEEEIIDKWRGLSDEEESFLLEEVFTDAEKRELFDLREKKVDPRVRAVELVLEHLERARGEERSRDKKFRKRLEEINKKLC